MKEGKKILLTGAAGFIGSYLLGYLNGLGYSDIIICDDFSEEDKWFNFDSKIYTAKVERDILFDWLADQHKASSDFHIDFVFHLGARTDTTEFNYSVHEKLNVQYSKSIWDYCTKENIPLVYASSAATYGNGEMGYKDDHDLVKQLKPMNPYGISKNEFDKWVLQQENHPPFWAGLKFFNVYGPNEYHKERMASMVYHGFNQVRKTGKVKLFRSHKEGFKDGEQLRDFIYVKNVAAVCVWLMNQQPAPGLYNLGTGKARSFNDLLHAVFAAMGRKPHIEYVDMPLDIREKYQYFTEAEMHKLHDAGYTASFDDIEAGVNDYVTHYLSKNEYY